MTHSSLFWNAVKFISQVGEKVKTGGGREKERKEKLAKMVSWRYVRCRGSCNYSYPFYSHLAHATKKTHDAHNFSRYRFAKPKVICIYFSVAFLITLPRDINLSPWPLSLSFSNIVRINKCHRWKLVLYFAHNSYRAFNCARVHHPHAFDILYSSTSFRGIWK